jgi:hypothetical protein
VSSGGGARDRWGLRAGCGIVRAMETRRSAGALFGRGWIIGAVLASGCGEEPRRFSGDATVVPTDFGGPRDVGLDTADVTDLDAGRDAGRDARADAAIDATTDASDGPRDVVAESSVLGCRSNADCPSPDLYCNGPGCDAPGFCVPRRAASTCTMTDASAGDLVCGCDGMTYGGLCQLQVEGVRLVRFGLCPRD